MVGQSLAFYSSCKMIDKMVIILCINQEFCADSRSPSDQWVRLCKNQVQISASVCNLAPSQPLLASLAIFRNPPL
jgi:hypothetical protein